MIIFIIMMIIIIYTYIHIYIYTYVCINVCLFKGCQWPPASRRRRPSSISPVRLLRVWISEGLTQTNS